MVDSSVLNMDVIDECSVFFLIVYNGKYIYVCDRMAYYFALSCKVVERNPSLFEYFCFFKFHLFCPFHHLFLQHFLNFSCVSFEDFTCFTYCLLVFFVSLTVDTWPLAFFDVILETGLESSFFHGFFVQRKTTSTWFVDFLYNIEYGIHGADVTIRTIKRAIFLIYGASFVYSWVWLLSYANTWISLAVF